VSEFGKGQVYCLGLFIAHNFQYGRDLLTYKNEMMPESLKKSWPGLWFSGASDHLSDLVTIHKDLKIQKRLEELQSKVLNWGHVLSYNHTIPTEKDINWALEEAEALLFEIDKANGIEVEKGDYD